MNRLKRIKIIFLAFLCVIFSLPVTVSATVLVNADIPCKSAILMEGITGKVLFEKDADVRHPPASITKIMSLLLVMESIDSGKISIEDKVTASPHAVSMGGSQIWLRENEVMTVDELLRATAISSANDATVALAELVAGSEEGFVTLMNEKAKELGMVNTNFVNASGLDAENHYSTARDICIMANELMKYPLIKNYSTKWMDELREGKTQLVNTNKLVRFYKGATGLKTGTTNGAGSCLCATAERDNLPLIAVSMGSTTSDERFQSCRGLLDYGFANFKAVKTPAIEPPLEPLKVKNGTIRNVGVKSDASEFILCEKGKSEDFKIVTDIRENVEAPVSENDNVGSVKVLQDGVVISQYNLLTAYPVDEISFKWAFGKVLKNVFYMGG